MPTINHRTTLEQRRKNRVRKNMLGTAERPRLTIYRSNKYVLLQAIDDVAGKTVASAHQKAVAEKKATKTERAILTAGLIAEQLKKKKITKLIFDRGSYRYHGRVKAVAEALRSHEIAV